MRKSTIRMARKEVAPGSEHPGTASYLNNIRAAWKSKGNNEEAMKYFEMALAVFKKTKLARDMKISEDHIKDLKDSMSANDKNKT